MQMSLKSRRTLLLFILISLLCLGIAFVGWRAESFISFVQYCGYWVTAVTTSLFLFAIYSVRKGRRFRPERWSPWIFPAALTAVILTVIFFQERNQPKIFADEVLLVGVSQNMHLKREATVPLTAHYLGDVYHTSQPTVDKRPLLFPFLTSLLHDATGYRAANAIVLNYLAAFFLGLAVFRIAWLLTSWNLAIGAPALLFLTPLVGHSVSSAGFEILNLLFIALFLLVAIAFLGRPTPARLFLLVTTAALLASIRYESILYSLGLPVFFWLGYRKNPRLAECDFLPFLPLLYFLPLVFLRLHFSFEHFWQMESRGTETAFGGGFLIDNILESLYFFFNTDPFYLNSTLVGILGAIAIVYLLVTLPRELRTGVLDEPAPAATCLVLLLGLGHLLLLQFYHYGQFTNTIVARLSLPIILLLAIAPFWALGRLCKPGRFARFGLWPAILLIALWGMIFPSRIAMGKTNLQMLHSRDAAWALEQLSSFDPKRTLFVTHTGPFPIIHRFCTTTAASLNRDPRQTYFYKDAGYFDEIIVLETLINSPYSDEFQYKVGHPLDEAFQYEVMASTRMHPTALTRLLRITGVEDFASYQPDPDTPEDLSPAQKLEWEGRYFMRQLP
jgi:F0F1-type ATP synthase assembly protein I